MGYKIKDKGVFQKYDGTALKSAEEILLPSCDCGIDCCNGIQYWKDYNSTTGVVTNKVTYMKDGVLVVATEEVALADIKAMKALALVPTPTPSPSVTPTISVTPSITPSISVTSSVTPTPTPTPTPSGV
jgi:hypothetical protein